MIVVISTTAFRCLLAAYEETKKIVWFLVLFSVFPSRREDRPSDDWWPRQDSVHLPHHTHSRKIRCPASRDCSSALHSRKTHCSPSCSKNAEPSNRRPPNCAGCANTPWRSLHNTSPSFVSGVGAASPSNTSSAPSPSVVSRSSAARTY